MFAQVEVDDLELKSLLIIPFVLFQGEDHVERLPRGEQVEFFSQPETDAVHLDLALAQEETDMMLLDDLGIPSVHHLSGDEDRLRVTRAEGLHLVLNIKKNRSDRIETQFCID